MQISSPSLCFVPDPSPYIQSFSPLINQIPKVNKKTQQTPSPHQSTTTLLATLARGGQHLHCCHSWLTSASDKPIFLPLHPSQNPPTTTKNPANPISPPVLLISLLPSHGLLIASTNSSPFYPPPISPKNNYPNQTFG